MKLRLLLLQECNRRCKGCCNKNFDLNSLEECTSYKGYEAIMLTGGEPMLYPKTILRVVKQIRSETDAPIYLYTAYREEPRTLAFILSYLDGMTLTLHTKKDVIAFVELTKLIKIAGFTNKSLRLNVFRGIGLKNVDTTGWVVKQGIKWIKDCPLPLNEKFMKLKQDDNYEH